MTALPERLRERTAIAAAADRFYRTSKPRTWWWSLFWNTFPIHRGGGSKALDYPMELLRNGWSILIYPEGGRAKTGRIKRFHHGPTIMAMQAKVPVIPVFLEGLEAIMPRGTTTPRPGPVSVRMGAPISLEGIESVPEGTAKLEHAMRELGRLNVQSAAAY
jgi:1-acyl-sn-glycerol-3-phosphate acyltransferase